MERNPLIVVSSRLDSVSNEVRGSRNSAPSIVTAWKRAREADVGNTIVDCHDEALSKDLKDVGAYSVTSDPQEIERTHNYKPPSGLARVARTVTKFDRFCNHDLIIHLPEHHVEIDPKFLRALMYPLASSDVGMATLVCSVTPNLPKDAPKVSVNWNPDRMVYVMPDARVGTISNFSRDGLKLTDGQVYAHIPVYIYRRAVLDRVVREPPCDRELDENIEALRVLELGYRVESLFVPNVTPATYEDKLARYD
tara:strand:- start:345 stop:1100 length:756 start_codon:yes stop_codon:yes gene_type:complete